MLYLCIYELIIFDEIQEANRGLTSLKYFSENAPEYHVIAAGSLLGITLHQHVSFPVGKVDFLDLYPLNFYEFLCAIGQERFAEYNPKTAIRTSLSDYRKETWLTNVPLYAIGNYFL